MTNQSELVISDLPTYLAARKGLLAAREGFFGAVRAYLRPEQRPDAALLGDTLADSKARNISEDDWVANPVRGYLTVLESVSTGRPFRLCVLQQGNELRIGVRYPPGPGRVGDPERAIRNAFAHDVPLIKRTSSHVMLDWHFDARDLYVSAQSFEDAVFKVGAIFEASLQALVIEPVNSLD